MTQINHVQRRNRMKRNLFIGVVCIGLTLLGFQEGRAASTSAGSDIITTMAVNGVTGQTTWVYDPVTGDGTPSTTTVTLTRSDTLSLKISLDPGSSVGADADWFLTVMISGTASWNGDYYYNLQRWVPTASPLTSYRGALKSVQSYEIFTISAAVLQPGTYTFGFNVDLDPDGSIAGHNLFGSGAIVVTVTP